MRSPILMLSMLILGAGCARSSAVTGLEEGAPCLEDGDCADGMQCIDGACRVVIECSSSADCAVTQSCQGGACVGNDSCTVAADCPPDQTCVDGRCTRMGACTDDTTCPPEAHCEDGFCAQNAACTDDGDCPADQSCGDQGVCERNPVCDDDSDCPLTQSCVDGSCQRNDACVADTDCPENQHCGDGGVCERNDPCVGNADCPIDQHCQDGTCERNGVCQTNADCPLDQACVDHVCLRHAGCRADSDCDNQLWCDGQDLCDIALGCVIEDVPELNDFISCTVDSCDEANNVVRHTPDHAFCNDNEACTDDTCDLSLGCQNVANDANMLQQVDGDCRTAVCSGGHTVQSPNDSDLPADDGIACTVARCQAGNIQVQYTHTMCEDYKPCTRDECTAQGCINPSDNNLTPPQVPGQYCQKQVCVSGDIQTVEDTTDTAPDSNVNDCVNPACSGIVPTTVPDNFEIPIVSTPPDPCMKWVCTAGAPTQGFDDLAVGPADAAGNCRKNICVQGVTPVFDPSDPPTDSDPNDCFKPQCNDAVSGDVENVPDDHDHPAAANTPNDCKKPACRSGDIVDIADATDLPVNTSTSDCQQPVCNGMTPGTAADDTETPPAIAGNCRQETCVGGAPSASVQDNGDLPAGDGIACTVEECVNGSPAHRADNSLCSANFCDGPAYCDATPVSGGCKTGTDPTCAPANATCFTSACVRTANAGAGACVDTAINVDGDLTTKCGPDNAWQGGIPSSDDDCADSDEDRYRGAVEGDDGKDNDCDGYTDEGIAALSCGARSHAPVPPVLFEPVTLTVPLTRDINQDDGSVRLAWTVTGDPSGNNNSLALQNATSNAVTFEPVLFGDYTLRLTLSSADATVPVRTCDYPITIPAPSDELNVTMIMSTSNVDLDLHLLGPDGYSWGWGYAWDYAEQEYWYATHWWCPYGDDVIVDNASPYGICDSYGSNSASYLNDCHWSGCNACKVVVPGQDTCVTPTYPADWWPWGSYGNEDPSLDVDNRRGCYQDGTRTVCTPESISVPVPNKFNENYTAAVHYFGPSTGPATTVKVRIYCKTSGGQLTQMFTSPTLSPGQWWFVRDVQWSTSGCSAFATPTRTAACGAAGGLTCVY